MSSQENFKQFAQHFDHIYVLTIAAAKERHENIREEFGDWNVEIIYGVDKKDIDIDELEKQEVISAEKNAAIDPASNYTKGLICCSWGHRMIYEHMIRNNYQNVLVLEDDALKVRSFPFDLSEVIKAIPMDADLIYWGWLGGVHQNMKQPFWLRKLLYVIKKVSGRLKQFDNPIYQGMVAEPYNRYFDKAGKHGGSHAYSLNQKTARMFVDLQTPIIFHPDRVFSYVLKKRMANVYISVPPVITEATYSGNIKKLPTMLDYHQYPVQ